MTKPHSCEPAEVRLETAGVPSVDVDGFEETSTVLAGTLHRIPYDNSHLPFNFL